MVLKAPRSLNEPVICSFSSLRYTSPPAISLRPALRTSGVRRTSPSIRRLAARTSVGRRSENLKPAVAGSRTVLGIMSRTRGEVRGRRMIDLYCACYFELGKCVQLDEIGERSVDYSVITAAPLAGPFPCAGL